jgi:uncharacterized protein YkwD
MLLVFQAESRDSVAKKPALPAPPAPAAIAEEALAAHNQVRKLVGAPELKWDDGLAKTAHEWARHLCRDRKGALEHRPRTPNSPGENLWQGATTESKVFPISEAVTTWADERKFYSEKSGACSGGVCGHYTQVVWKNTTQVGCGVAVCASGAMTATVWVCNYRPAGNVIGARPY